MNDTLRTLLHKHLDKMCDAAPKQAPAYYAVTISLSQGHSLELWSEGVFALIEDEGWTLIQAHFNIPEDNSPQEAQ